MGLLLDKVLGVHGNKRYKKKDIKELIKLHEFNPEAARGENHEEGDLTHEEVGILLSTIDLRDSKVVDKDVMIPLSDVFIVNESQKYNKDLIDQLFEKRFTRFPICKAGNDGKDGRKLELLGLIGMKGILGADMHSNLTIGEIIKTEGISLTNITYVAKDTNLLTMFRIFQSAKTSLIGIVNKCSSDSCSKKVGEALLSNITPDRDLKEGQDQKHKELHVKLWSKVEDSILTKAKDQKEDECFDILGFVHIKDIFEKLCDIGEFEDDRDPIRMLTKNIFKKFVPTMKNIDTSKSRK